MNTTRRGFLKTLGAAALWGAIQAAPVVALAQHSLAQVYERAKITFTSQWLPKYQSHVIEGHGRIADTEYYAAEMVDDAVGKMFGSESCDWCEVRSIIDRAFDRRERLVDGVA